MSPGGDKHDCSRTDNDRPVKLTPAVWASMSPEAQVAYAERNDLLWRVIRAIQPGAGGDVDECAETAIAFAKGLRAATRPAPPASFLDEIRQAVNRHSKENGSDTPDFVLAQFLCSALEAFDFAARRRDEWDGRSKKASVTAVNPDCKEHGRDAIPFDDWHPCTCAPGAAP